MAMTLTTTPMVSKILENGWCINLAQTPMAVNTKLIRNTASTCFTFTFYSN